MFTENAPFGSRRRPRGGLDYPVRFFNLLVFERPDNLRDIFKWAKNFYRSSGLFRDVVDKMSRYPVTSIEVTGDNAEKWSQLLNNDLRVREKLVAIGINKNTFGNAFISIIPRFTRYLYCKQCKSHHCNPIDKVKFKYLDNKFHGRCNGCQKDSILTIKDEYKKGDVEDISKHLNIRIWPTESIHIKANRVTGEHKIIYKLDKHEIDGIRKGDRFLIETMPSDFLDAVHRFGEKASIELDPTRTFWYKEEDIEEPNSTGMGLPFFFSAWKTLWQIFIYRKAQECIVSDHMLPYRVLFPQAMNNVDPISAIDLGQWRTSIQQMIHRWYNDPNEIGEVPFPIGYQQLGGQGKAMSLMNDIQQINREFLIECGIPPELIYGGMSWSGSSVTLRMLENRFLYEVNMHNTFLKHLCRFISSHFDIKEPKSVQLSPFRMADDIAKANMYMGLAAQGKISDQRALGILGDAINVEVEAETIAREREARAKALTAIQTAQAEAAAEAGRVQNREQVITQLESQALQNTLSPSMNGTLADATSILTTQGLINKLNSLPEAQRQQELQNIMVTNPQLYQQLTQGMGMGSPEQAGPMGQESKPLPEQKPPRSEGVNRRI